MYYFSYSNSIKKKRKFLFVLFNLIFCFSIILFVVIKSNIKSKIPDASIPKPPATNFSKNDIKIKFNYGQSKLKCDEEKLLILIPTRPQAYQTRSILRNTWLHNLTSDITYRFVIGTTEDKKIQIKNYYENKKFGDVILTNIHDSYENLSQKATSYFQWQQRFCPDVEWILKTDDDTIVNIPRLQYWIEKDFDGLKKEHDEKLIIGHVWNRAQVQRGISSKWFVPEELYENKFYPDYANGATYILTSTTIKLLLKEMENHEMITVDDAYFTGIVAESAGIARIDRPHNFPVFYGNFPSSFKCDENDVPYFTAIYVDKNNQKMSSNLIELHDNLKSFPCRKPHHLFSFFY